MLSRSLVLACALSAVVTVGSCKLNPLFCDDDRGCHSGQSCDTQAHQCKAVVGGDGSVGDGGSGDMAGGCNCTATAPICVPPACFGCQTQVDPEATCSALSTAAPHCLTTGSGAGACVACRDARDCMDPALAICDGTSHQCRACTADSDCASLVCDLTSPAPARGRCVDPGQVAYVDAMKDEGTGLTPDSTRKTIPEGIDTAVANGRGYVRVAATGTYTANITVNANRKVFLVGAPGTFVNTGGTAIDVNSGGQLTLRGFIVSSANDGVNCSGSTSKLTAYRSQFINNSGNGINTSTCPIVLDGVWIDSNGAAGVVVSNDFDIRNSIITRNKAMGGLREAGAPGTAVFINNTVADNVGPYGVDCTMGSGYTIKNTILYNNQKNGSNGAISETTCALIASAADIPGNGVVVSLSPTKAPGFKTMTSGADAYHLDPSSPCRDKGTNDGAPDHDYDGEPRLTNSTGVVDIGADEVQ